MSTGAGASADGGDWRATEEKYPDSNKGKSVAVTRLRDEMVSEFRLTLYVMLAAVGVVLLIACANLANMLLAKAVGRAREMAIRSAVGAGRGRIVRQLITESILLALIAGAAGLALAFWGSRTLMALAPGDIPRLAEAGIDGDVLLFALGISMVASLMFGLAPALQVLRVDINSSLKQSVQRAGGGSLADRMRQALVVAEIALSVIFVAAAGCSSRVSSHYKTLRWGFRRTRCWSSRRVSPPSIWRARRRGIRFYTQLLPELRAIPGVRRRQASSMVPGHTSSNGSYWIDQCRRFSNREVPTPC